MDTYNVVKKALMQLRSESIACGDSNEEIRSFFNKYDELFLGPHRNFLQSDGLQRILSHHFAVQISLTDLNAMLPTLGKELGMELKKIYRVSDLKDKTITEDFLTYRIQLHQG